MVRPALGAGREEQHWACSDMEEEWCLLLLPSNALLHGFRITHLRFAAGHQLVTRNTIQMVHLNLLRFLPDSHPNWTRVRTFLTFRGLEALLSDTHDGNKWYVRPMIAAADEGLF